MTCAVGCSSRRGEDFTDRSGKPARDPAPSFGLDRLDPVTRSKRVPRLVRSTGRHEVKLNFKWTKPTVGRGKRRFYPGRECVEQPVRTTRPHRPREPGRKRRLDIVAPAIASAGSGLVAPASLLISGITAIFFPRVGMTTGRTVRTRVRPVPERETPSVLAVVRR